jgi:cell shape-determining protein MreC
MTYLSDKAKQKRKIITYTVSVFVFLCFIFFWTLIKRSVYPITEPVVVTYSEAKESFSIFPEFFATYITSRRSLILKQHQLETRIEDLENILAEKDAALREQEDIQGITVNSSEDPVHPKLVLYPLLQDITHLYSTILLSKGSKDGITNGETVYIRGNQAVCTIQEVYPSTSLCVLLTANGVTTEGVTSSSSLTLTLVGRGGHFLADIPRGAGVEQGEIVYLRSNPKVILGTVRSIANNDQDTSWHVFVEGAYNPLKSSIFYVQE